MGGKKALGKYGEDKAIDYLKNKGHAILKRNYYTRYGEIDIFSKIKNRVHVIEVKFFQTKHLPIGYKINWKKQRRMINCTNIFLDQFNLRSHYVQFDLITVHGDQVKHLENIFTLTGA